MASRLFYTHLHINPTTLKNRPILLYINGSLGFLSRVYNLGVSIVWNKCLFINRLLSGSLRAGSLRFNSKKILLRRSEIMVATYTCKQQGSQLSHIASAYYFERTHAPRGRSRGVEPPLKIYKSNSFHHDCVQFEKLHSHKAILPSIVLSQQCCEVRFISLT